jgi:hypothetical protein
MSVELGAPLAGSSNLFAATIVATGEQVVAKRCRDRAAFEREWATGRKR